MESLAKRSAARFLDLVQALLYRRPLLPPFSMRRLVGEARWTLSGQGFFDHGRHFITKLAEDAGLMPESHVLDLGSGCGRIAIPLTEVLAGGGRYVGLEVRPAMVRWCQREITSRYPNFDFVLCNVRNRMYQPEGKVDAERYVFPFQAAEFDLLIATSLFTHLMPSAAKNYVGETARVLKPRGRLFSTFFLLESGLRSADGILHFAHPLENGAATIDAHLPERAVAYRLDWVLEVFREPGLELIPPVRWGGWTGRQAAYSGQDVLIFQKKV